MLDHITYIYHVKYINMVAEHNLQFLWNTSIYYKAERSNYT